MTSSQVSRDYVLSICHQFGLSIESETQLNLAVTILLEIEDFMGCLIGDGLREPDKGSGSYLLFEAKVRQSSPEIALTDPVELIDSLSYYSEK